MSKKKKQSTVQASFSTLKGQAAQEILKECATATASKLWATNPAAGFVMKTVPTPSENPLSSAGQL